MKKDEFHLLVGSLAACIGLLIIIFPAFWIKVVVTMLGAGSVVYGIYNLKYTKPLYENTVYERSILIKSILSIIIGVIAFIFPLAFGSTAWAAVTWVLIIYLIVSAVIGFYAASLLKNTEINRKRYFLENLGLVAVAVLLILISPKALGTAIVRIIGIAVMLAGAGFITYFFVSKKNIVEAEVVVKDDVETESESTAE